MPRRDHRPTQLRCHRRTQLSRQIRRLEVRLARLSRRMEAMIERARSHQS